MLTLYLSGNEAIAHGLVQAGVRFITGYPGTPSSEIIPAAQKLVKEKNIKAFIDWAINEKVAFEIAYSVSLTGIKTAVTMKQVGLNVAMDPFMNSAYVGTDGAMVVVSVDDPGPHSSQTEQDSRFFAMTGKVPVLDPSTVQEAYEFAKKAVQLSKRYSIPVMLRSSTRISHGRGDVKVEEDFILEPINATFKILKDWDKKLPRYAATPRQRLMLHGLLNEKIAEIEKLNELRTFFSGDILILSSGAVFSYLYELIEEHGLEDKVTLAKVDMPYPMKKFDFSGYKRVITIEESMPVIELQLCTEGRRNGIVPKQGELTPDVCEEILERIGLIKKGKTISVPPLKRPSLCPGCGHRIALYALKKVFGKKAVYSGDIGCYTLALNFGVTDTVLCMGASVSFGLGIKKAFELSGKNQDVVAIIGDSTFFHTGIPPLIDAVHYRVPFLTVILDNKTVAMTGNQKTLSDHVSSFGEPVTPIVIENVVQGIGVKFIQAVDPYDFNSSIKILKEAKKFLKENKEPAVIIFRHLCVNTKEGLDANPIYNVKILKEVCKGCKVCITEFECPAIFFNEEEGKVDFDKTLCISCGCCVHVCPTKAIVLI
ncbi:MAG: indolepyruvate ferredoxin oxidoreductase subunit alpha [Thermodesulfovibrio sp.]|nr:indolepyruvate ferredoxin oxidoreductase subunit alpha [Thermodesulfovibrio sp.]